MLPWLDPLAEATRAGLAWLLPPEIFSFGWPLRKLITLRVTALPLSRSDLDVLGLAKDKAHPVCIELDERLGFRREVTIPSAAVSEIDRVAALQLRATLPKAASGLIWRRVASRTQNGRTTADYVILTEEALAGVVDTCRAAGVELRQVVLQGASELLYPDLGARDVHKSRMLKAVLGLTAGAALMQTVLYEEARGRAAAQLLEVEAAVQEKQALLDARLQSANPKTIPPEAIQAAITTFQSAEFPLVYLDDLTRSLPDSVWVSELTLDQSGLHLSGFASMDLGELLTEIGKLSWVATAALVGPAVIDPTTGQTRFEVQIAVKPPRS
jgi:Tfp pilus assembly protein PilN